jgi:hypothetical protein
VADDPMGKARLAVSSAKTIEALDKLRRLVEERTAQGTFTRDQHDELVGLMRTKAEMLIGDSEDSDVEHFDAAEIEAEARA